MDVAKRPRGRPALPADERLVLVPIRLRAETVASLDAMAGPRGRTTLARDLLEQAVTRATRKTESQKGRK